MPITFDCACGKTLRVPDEHAGKRVKCPACAGVATVPKPEPEPMFEVVEDPSEPLVAPPKAPVRAKPAAKPVVASVDDDDDDDDRRGYGVKKSRRDDDDEEEEKPKPKKKKKIKARSSRPRDDYDRSSNNNSTSATREIIGGLFAMVIGGGLFLFALAHDRISIYGIILFICGLIGLLKGLAGGSGEH